MLYIIGNGTISQIHQHECPESMQKQFDVTAVVLNHSQGLISITQKTKRNGLVVGKYHTN
jgi:hypothetical protein